MAEIANPMPRERPECRVLGIGRQKIVQLTAGFSCSTSL